MNDEMNGAQVDAAWREIVAELEAMNAGRFARLVRHGLRWWARLRSGWWAAPAEPEPWSVVGLSRW